MVKRRKIVRKQAQPVKVEEDFEEEFDLDEEDAVEEPEDAEDEDYEDEEEEEEVKPVKVARRGVPAVVADKSTPPADIKKRVISKSDPEPELEKEKRAPIAVKAVDDQVADALFGNLLDTLAEGKALIITRLKGNKYQVTQADALQASGRKMTNAEVWNQVVNPEFLDWHAEWNEKSFEEKKKHAKKVKATWEPHDDPRIEVMRITQAVREAEGIEKYKPEYRSRAARAALRG